jgi:hydroxymethylglutaryl-CoA reductase
MAVGLVGSATKVHPVAQLGVKMLGIKTATELGEIIVAVGVAQNVAELRVLATEGMRRAHMALHARNVAVGAGTTTVEKIDAIAGRMVAEKAVRADRAIAILAEVHDGRS